MYIFILKNKINIKKKKRFFNQSLDSSISNYKHKHESIKLK